MHCVKDKRIERSGLAYIATVDWWDGSVTNAGRHATMKAAQKALEGYPSDVFEGYDDPAGDASLRVMDNARREHRSRPKRRTLKEYIRLYERLP